MVGVDIIVGHAGDEWRDHLGSSKILGDRLWTCRWETGIVGIESIDYANADFAKCWIVNVVTVARRVLHSTRIRNTAPIDLESRVTVKDGQRVNEYILGGELIVVAQSVVAGVEQGARRAGIRVALKLIGKLILRMLARGDE